MMDIKQRLRGLCLKTCEEAADHIEQLEARIKEQQAEIEGGEEAYGTLVDTIRDLREKLARTEKNHQATLGVVARMTSEDRRMS